jgi:hypothetical protein
MTQDPTTPPTGPRTEAPKDPAEFSGSWHPAPPTTASQASTSRLRAPRQPLTPTPVPPSAAPYDGTATVPEDDYYDDFADEEQDDLPEPAPLTFAERLRRIPPSLVILSLAAVLSVGFLIAQIASRVAPVPVLLSSGVVTGLVYVMVAVVAAMACWRAGHEGRVWTAILLAIVGGVAAIVASLSFAGALVLFLVLGF